MVAHAKPSYITPHDYLERERDAERKSEYYDGVIVAMAGASPEHNALAFDIAGLLMPQLRRSGCQGFGSDQRLRVHKRNRYYYPDITVVCDKPQFEELAGMRSLLNPTLVIEVLSPSTERTDRVEKFDGYRTIETLTSYVLVAQDMPRIELLTRQSDGSWRYEIASGLEETLRLDAIGCSLSLAEVYARVEFPQSVAEDEG